MAIIPKFISLYFDMFLKLLVFAGDHKIPSPFYSSKAFIHPSKDLKGNYLLLTIFGVFCRKLRKEYKYFLEFLSKPSKKEFHQ